MSTLSAVLVSFGLGGHTITCKAGVAVQGYESPESFCKRLEAGHYSKEPDPISFEDCPVLDKCSLLRKKPMLAIASPLPSASLEAGEVDRLDTRHSFVAQAMASDSGNGFGQLVRAHEACTKARPKEPGPLDSISIPDYVQWWRARGARVGRIQGSSIVWEA